MALLDSLIFVLGILVSVLIAFRFIEGQYFNLLSCGLNLAMFVLLCIENPGNINFLIISVYNLFRVSQAAINWTVLYGRGKNGKKSV